MRFDRQSLVMQAQTGLTDWDGDDFDEGLEMLLQTCTAQAELGEHGHQHLAQAYVQHLTNRLRIKNLLNHHPEILQKKLNATIFSHFSAFWFLFLTSFVMSNS